MTRECNHDFSLLKEYVSAYSIACNLKQGSYVSSAKKMHKVYYSLVNWHVEYQHQIEFFTNKYTNNQEVLIRISEAISDIGSSKFNWLNGSYKASRVMLRSSIENFIRSISAIDDEVQITEKNVFALFDRAKDGEIFNSTSAIKKSYTLLHSEYKELCKDTHTASSHNMEHITSLIDYPKYIEEKSNTTSNTFIRVVQNMLTVLCMIFNELYHKMHHRNKENIINSIPRVCRSAVLAP